MAAAISLAASIVALVGAADAVGKTFSKAHSLYRAPDKLLALNNKIADLTAVMRDIGNHPPTTNPAVTRAPVDHLQTLVERAMITDCARCDKGYRYKYRGVVFRSLVLAK